jgi:FkbM family methyltransferase
MEHAMEMIRHLVKPDMRCVDVGANVGLMTRAMLDSGASQVICVEPMPKWADELDKLQKELGKVQVFRMGLAERPCDGWSVTEDRNNLGNAGLTYFEGDFKIPVTTLDLLMRSEPFQFLKIDVEGMELEVIMGGWRSVCRNRPIIVYESHMEFAQHRQQPVFKWLEFMLRDIGYKLFDLRGGELVEVNHETAGMDTIAMP